MKKKISLGIGSAALVVICFGIFLLSGAGSTYYYSQIDNSNFLMTKMEAAISLGLSMNFETVTARYVDVGERKILLFYAIMLIRSLPFHKAKLQRTHNALLVVKALYHNIAVQILHLPGFDVTV